MTDSQGDFAETTRTIQVNVPSPDLAITKSDGGSSFVTGVNGAYTIAVANVGSAPTTGSITVVDTLPAGLTFVSSTGTDRTCGAVLQVVTCTNPGPVAHGSSAGDADFLPSGDEGAIIRLGQNIRLL